MAQLLSFASFNDFYRHNLPHMEAHFYVYLHVFKWVERLERKEGGVYNAYNVVDEAGRQIIGLHVTGSYYLFSFDWTPQMLEIVATQVEVAKCKTNFQFLGQRDLVAGLLAGQGAKWQIIKDRLIYRCQHVTAHSLNSQAVVQNAAAADAHQLVELTLAYDKAEYPAKPSQDEVKAYTQVQYGIASRNMFVVRHQDIICSILQVIHTADYNRPILGSLYTLHTARDKGFASLLLQTVTGGLLSTGYEECGLFADKTNPAANKAFLRVGYKPIYDWLNVAII